MILLEGAGAGSEDTRDVASDPMKLTQSAAMKNWPTISVVFQHVSPAHRTQPSPYAPLSSPFLLSLENLHIQARGLYFSASGG